MAPEIVMKREYNGFATDVWSLGVILYLMLCGNHPFRGTTERELYSKISKGYFSIPETMPLDTKRLITKMLSVDAYKRPTLKEVIINHSNILIDMFRSVVDISEK